MNPVIIIGAAALVLSLLVITVLNKPSVPLITSAFIVTLIFFVISTYLIDSALSNSTISEQLSGFVSFLVMKPSPSAEELEFSFRVFMFTDIGLFASCIISMLVESMLILRKNSEQ